jgi:hypothetical protein
MCQLGLHLPVLVVAADSFDALTVAADSFGLSRARHRQETVALCKFRPVQRSKAPEEACKSVLAQDSCPVATSP